MGLIFFPFAHSAPVAFYQLVKVLIAPAQAAYQYLWFSIPSSRQAVVSLVIMTAGVCLLVVTDLSASTTPLLCGMVALVSSVVGQAVCVPLSLCLLSFPVLFSSTGSLSRVCKPLNRTMKSVA